MVNFEVVASAIVNALCLLVGFFLYRGFKPRSLSSFHALVAAFCLGAHSTGDEPPGGHLTARPTV